MTARHFALNEPAGMVFIPGSFSWSLMVTTEMTRNVHADCNRARIFLLSPASLSGIRGRLVLTPGAGFELAALLHRDGLPLGELFTICGPFACGSGPALGFSF